MANASRRAKLSGLFTGNHQHKPGSVYEARLILSDWATALDSTTENNAAALILGAALAYSTWGQELARGAGGIPAISTWGPSAARISTRALHVAYGRPRALPADRRNARGEILHSPRPANAPVLYVHHRQDDLASARVDALFTDAILAAGVIRAGKSELGDEMSGAYNEALQHAEQASEQHAIPLAIAMAAFRTCAGTATAAFSDLFPNLRGALAAEPPVRSVEEALVTAIINLASDGRLPGVTLSPSGIHVDNQAAVVTRLVGLITSNPEVRNTLARSLGHLGMLPMSRRPATIPLSLVPSHLFWRLGATSAARITDREQEPPVFREPPAWLPEPDRE